MTIRVRVPALGHPPAPRTSPDERGLRLGRLLWRPLAGFSSVVPPLAMHVHTDHDGTDVEVVLDDASWSDGTPVRAADVVASATRVPHGDDIHITAVDERRVTIRGPGAIRLLGALTPARFTGGQVDPHITNGPYRLASHEPAGATLTRVGDAGHLPDRIEVLAVPDVDEALAALRRSELDVLLEADEDVVAAIIADPGLAVVALPDDARTIQVLGFNVTRPATADPGVRAVLTHGVDRLGLAVDVYHGIARPGRERGAHATAVAPETALTLLVNAENRLRVAAGERIVTDWRRNRIDARLQVEPWPRFVRRLGDGDFDCFLLSVRDTTDGPGLWAPERGLLARLTGYQGSVTGHADVLPATEITVHATWAALRPTALRHVPLLVTALGGRTPC